MKKVYKGKIKLDGIEYDVEVRDGVRYINGKTVGQFVETLNQSQLDRSALIGVMALKDETEGRKTPKGKLQYYLNEDLETGIRALTNDRSPLNY